MLSYDYKIKPLRDSSSSNLLPSVINYRVDGVRNGKINEIEAYNIISLMSACIEDPNYKDKSFGVISVSIVSPIFKALLILRASVIPIS